MKVKVESKQNVYCVCYEENEETKMVALFKDEKEALECYRQRQRELWKIASSDTDYYYNEKDYSEDNEDAYPCFTGKTSISKLGSDINHEPYSVKMVHMFCYNHYFKNEE